MAHLPGLSGTFRERVGFHVCASLGVDGVFSLGIPGRKRQSPEGMEAQNDGGRGKGLGL